MSLKTVFVITDTVRYEIPFYNINIILKRKDKMGSIKDKQYTK